MSTYLGSTLISGIATETKTNAHSLLDWKPADHILNEMSWLRGDTFSWQSGDVYVAAYGHLSADYTGATQKTETVGSYTITYYEATDSHKIILPDQETIADNIYNESGVAWYYILDTTNTRFKLPRSTHGEIVEKYQNGTEWYRVYSDGWCEQGGRGELNEASTTTITLLKTFNNTNYSVSAVSITASTAQDAEAGLQCTPISASQITLTAHYLNPNNQTACWTACGYISDYAKNSQYKYLYFYVGEFSQSATEQTAGINAELFNEKADVDAVWTPSTSTSAQKETIVGWGMPDYTSGVSKSANTSYTAESNGFVYGSIWQAAPTITINGVTLAFAQARADIYGGQGTSFYPIKKGSTWSCTIATTFFPAVGG